MKDTIKAQLGGYKVVPVVNAITGEKGVRIDDGHQPLFAAKLTDMDEYLSNQTGNDCFNFCEVFSTVDGKQYIYWRDEEANEDFITPVSTVGKEEA